MPIRLFVQKQASASTSKCTSWQKNCSAKHGILKRNKRKNLMFLYNKIAESQAPKVQTLKGQRYVKLA